MPDIEWTEADLAQNRRINAILDRVAALETENARLKESMTKNNLVARVEALEKA